jgi:hypothetical protein
MYVLSAKLTFHVPGAGSLKDKRQIRRNLVEKVRQRFNVSIAEVDAQDVHRTLVIGITVVSSEMAHAQNSLDEVIRFMENNPHAELTGVEKQDLM